MVTMLKCTQLPTLPEQCLVRYTSWSSVKTSLDQKPWRFSRITELYPCLSVNSLEICVRFFRQQDTTDHSLFFLNHRWKQIFRVLWATAPLSAVSRHQWVFSDCENFLSMKLSTFLRRRVISWFSCGDKIFAYSNRVNRLKLINLQGALKVINRRFPMRPPFCGKH